MRQPVMQLGLVAAFPHNQETEQVQLAQQRKRRHPADHQPEDHDPDRDADLLQLVHRRMLRPPRRSCDAAMMKIA